MLVLVVAFFLATVNIILALMDEPDLDRALLRSTAIWCGAGALLVALAVMP